MNGDVEGIETLRLGGAGSIGRKLLRLPRLLFIMAIAEGDCCIAAKGTVDVRGETAGEAPNSDMLRLGNADRVGSVNAEYAPLRPGRAGAAILGGAPGNVCWCGRGGGMSLIFADAEADS